MIRTRVRHSLLVASLGCLVGLQGCASSPPVYQGNPNTQTTGHDYGRNAGPEPAVCSGRLAMEVRSIRRSDRGIVTLEAEYLNIANADLRISAYSGGANGRDTYLIADTGEKWSMGNNTLNGKVFQPDVRTRVTYQFKIVTGGRDVTSFNFTNWVQLLNPAGMSLGGGFGGFCKLEVRNIPLAGA